MLDFFFHMGAMRQNSPKEILNKFLPAFAENPELATKAAFALRNIRGGMGERRTFQIILRWLAFNEPELVNANLHNIPHYGRWDDVLWCLRTPCEQEALAFIWTALTTGDKLCAKWMPREGKSMHEVAVYLARKYGISRKVYRQILANNTQVVENSMCANRWGDITYSHVPSVAFKKYRKAFMRHDEDRFRKFLEKAMTGEEKIHAGAIFPHDIIKEALGYRVTSPEAMDAQWKNLPDYSAPGGTLVVSDVSGSMRGLPMEVSVSLGIYFAERLEGPFKDILCTFSAKPTFFKLPEGNLVRKARAVKRMNWDMNTNLEAVFRLMLGNAKRYNLEPEKMPRNILILSDMQFDRCIKNGDASAMEMMRQYYDEAGYEFPNVIFWNLRSSTGVPAKMTESGVALLSGFSPALMQGVMEGQMTPMNIMLSTLNHPQYDRVVTDLTP